MKVEMNIEKFTAIMKENKALKEELEGYKKAFERACECDSDRDDDEEDEKIPLALKYLVDFLNAHACIGWILLNHPEKFNRFRDCIMYDKERWLYDELVYDFYIAKLEAIKKASEENDT